MTACACCLCLFFARCPAGSSSPTQNACGAGTYSAASSSVCSQCAAGRYGAAAPVSTTSQCTGPCSAGSWFEATTLACNCERTIDACDLMAGALLARTWPPSFPVLRARIPQLAPPLARNVKQVYSCARHVPLCTHACLIHALTSCCECFVAGNYGLASPLSTSATCTGVCDAGYWLVAHAHACTRSADTL